MVSSLFPLPFDEADVQQLCGGAFARADLWQREGHVQQPVVAFGSLGAEVQGTWKRLDVVQVTAPGGRLASTCSCGQPTLCVHAATMLLHWLRQPEAFLQGGSPGVAGHGGGLLATGDDEDREAEEPVEKTPAEDLATMLELFSMPDLREVARRRGVRTTARTKIDLVRQLSDLLSTAENVDAALAQLNQEAMLTLQVVDLLGPDLASEGAITNACGALGGATDTAALFALLNLALVGSVQYSAQAGGTYAVPTAVAQRLGKFGAPAAALEGGTRVGGAAQERGLDLQQTLLVLIHEAQRRAIAPRPGEARPATATSAYPDPRTAPSFWSIVTSPSETGATRAAGSPYRQARLAPIYRRL